MTRLNSTIFWLLVAVIVALSFYFLRAILLPFAIGIAIAYFLDPIVDKFEKLGWYRSLSALVTLFVFLALAIFLILLFISFILAQM